MSLAFIHPPSDAFFTPPGARGKAAALRPRYALAALIACGLAAVPAAATPVATNEQERELLGRVFPEPIHSVDFINHGPTNGPEELRLGFEYPREAVSRLPRVHHGRR